MYGGATYVKVNTAKNARKERAMLSVRNTFMVGVVSFGLIFGSLSLAHAGAAGSVTGEFIINGNTAQDVKMTGGGSGSAKILGFGGKGQKGDPKHAETVLQGVSVDGGQIAADVTISGNHA